MTRFTRKIVSDAYKHTSGRGWQNLQAWWETTRPTLRSNSERNQRCRAGVKEGKGDGHHKHELRWGSEEPYRLSFLESLWEERVRHDAFVNAFPTWSSTGFQKTVSWSLFLLLMLSRTSPANISVVRSSVGLQPAINCLLRYHLRPVIKGAAFAIFSCSE